MEKPVEGSHQCLACIKALQLQPWAPRRMSPLVTCWAGSATQGGPHHPRSSAHSSGERRPQRATGSHQDFGSRFRSLALRSRSGWDVNSHSTPHARKKMWHDSKSSSVGMYGKATSALGTDLRFFEGCVVGEGWRGVFMFLARSRNSPGDLFRSL